MNHTTESPLQMVRAAKRLEWASYLDEQEHKENLEKAKNQKQEQQEQLNIMRKELKKRNPDLKKAKIAENNLTQAEKEYITWRTKATEAHKRSKQYLQNCRQRLRELDI